MHLEGTVTIDASRDKVWEFLTGPHAVGQCAPGLESMEVIVPEKSGPLPRLGLARSRPPSQLMWNGRNSIR